MSDHITRAASMIERAQYGITTPMMSRNIADDLDAAGLLAKYPRLEVEGEWLIEVVDYHTCGAGPGSGAGHEPGCGTIPVGRLATPAHDAAVAAKALREAADEVYGDARFAGQYWHTLSAASWLRERAGHIEREGETDE